MILTTFILYMAADLFIILMIVYYDKFWEFLDIFKKGKIKGWKFVKKKKPIVDVKEHYKYHDEIEKFINRIKEEEKTTRRNN